MVFDLLKNAFEDENQAPKDPVTIVSSPVKWVRRPEPVNPPHSMIIEEIVEDSEDVESENNPKKNVKYYIPKSVFKPEKTTQRGRITKVKERKAIKIVLDDVTIGTKRYFSRNNPIHFCVKCCMGFMEVNELIDHFVKEHEDSTTIN
uniref:C2H2-type domain-containing protein n=1 Tax=Caenorhabditis tropicalis TaxID=1561998 RepID=A0A1I7UTS1_9PELO